MSTTNGRASYEERLERIETLLETIQKSPNPALRASAEELVQTLLEVHRAGLERIFGKIWDAGETGERIIHGDLAGDELVSSLMLLHGLHPQPIEHRVEQALESVRPHLHSHGGDMEVVTVEDGIVRLRLEGTCDGCPASAMTLKYAVEEAIYEAAPDVRAVETIDEYDLNPAADGEERGVQQPGPCVHEQENHEQENIAVSVSPST